MQVNQTFSSKDLSLTSVMPTVSLGSQGTNFRINSVCDCSVIDAILAGKGVNYRTNGLYDVIVSDPFMVNAIMTADLLFHSEERVSIKNAVFELSGFSLTRILTKASLSKQIHVNNVVKRYSSDVGAASRVNLMCCNFVQDLNHVYSVKRNILLRVIKFLSDKKSFYVNDDRLDFICDPLEFFKMADMAAFQFLIANGRDSVDLSLISEDFTEEFRRDYIGKMISRLGCNLEDESVLKNSSIMNVIHLNNIELLMVYRIANNCLHRLFTDKKWHIYSESSSECGVCDELLLDMNVNTLLGQ
ncbi:hypothetical protein [Aliivibrio fischeri]|uniref:hypothetical protein n=1 Tax=Aliivibrio fischeri TaxID=668 RepID=UPI0012D9452B|nr:hypothetical protein [Aliivibrio fischeri]MUJ20404.1 hypothetical protein [Aliivibrio fischeri]